MNKGDPVPRMSLNAGCFSCRLMSADAVGELAERLRSINAKIALRGRRSFRSRHMYGLKCWIRRAEIETVKRELARVFERTHNQRPRASRESLGSTRSFTARQCMLLSRRGGSEVFCGRVPCCWCISLPDLRFSGFMHMQEPLNSVRESTIADR
jgi:hypothetical protein